MRTNYHRGLFLLISMLSLAAITAKSWAVEPMEYFNSYVAGERSGGYRDGQYVHALFYTPEGLAFNDAGTLLYVADTSNNRIRQVDVSNGNLVSTLAGGVEASSVDGALEKATFNHPTRLVMASGDRLVAVDGGKMIRVIDLKEKTVKTLVNNISPWDIAYHPQEDAVYFTEPDLKKLSKVDMKTGVVTTILEANTDLPQPKTLTFHKDKICVSDGISFSVYALTVNMPKDAKKPQVNLQLLGKADKLLGMVSTDGILYGLQAGITALVRIASPSRPVSLATHWGFLQDDAITGFEPIMNFTAGDLIGFAVNPKEPRKFYLTKSYVYPCGIISVKDYEFDSYWKAAGPPSAGNGDIAMDFNYPKEKDPGVFRILLSGDSRTNISPKLTLGSDYGNGWFYGGDRMDTMGKQLEFFLNSEAAVRGVRTRFEVIEWNRAGHSLSSYAFYELPNLAKNYHVDMVLGLASSAGYENYYEEPISKLGVPQVEIDYEYLLKPLSKRLQSPVAKDLYERWKKIDTRETEKMAFPAQDNPQGFIASSEGQMRDDLLQMTGERLRLTSEKIASDGGPSSMVLFYVPGFDLKDDTMEPFWAELCAKYHFSYIDMTDAFNTMRMGYYPVYTRCCSDHYTAYGNRLIGYVLAHYLIDDKLIPFVEPEKKKP